MSTLTTVGSLAAIVALILLSPLGIVIVALIGSLVLNQ